LIKNPLGTTEGDKRKQAELLNKTETLRFQNLFQEYKVMLDIDNSDEEFEQEMKQVAKEASVEGEAQQII
jgi:hypothetical protein